MKRLAVGEGVPRSGASRNPLVAFLGKSRGSFEVETSVYFHTTSGRFCGAPRGGDGASRRTVRGCLAGGRWRGELHTSCCDATPTIFRTRRTSGEFTAEKSSLLPGQQARSTSRPWHTMWTQGRATQPVVKHGQRVDWHTMVREDAPYEAVWQGGDGGANWTPLVATQHRRFSEHVVQVESSPRKNHRCYPVNKHGQQVGHGTRWGLKDVPPSRSSSTVNE